MRSSVPALLGKKSGLRRGKALQRSNRDVEEEWCAPQLVSNCEGVSWAIPIQRSWREVQSEDALCKEVLWQQEACRLALYRVEAIATSNKAVHRQTQQRHRREELYA